MPFDPSTTPSEPDAPAPRPEDVRITREVDAIRIEYPWINDPAERRLTIIGGIVGSILLAPFLILIVYVVLAHVYDRTVITIRDGRLRVVNRPLPFPRGGSVRIADLASLYVKTSYRFHGPGKIDSTDHMGVARLRDGTEKQLLHEMSAKRRDERLKWVVEELARELASGRWSRS